ncbi:aldehyde dehydrogenase family protein [Vannielia litorea]|nr:aldehyde dehydrogenase family protein [Vannielia litorea]
MTDITAGWFDPAEYLIGGQWHDAPATLPIEDPSTGQEIGAIARCGRAEVADAVAAAQTALDGEWGGLTAAERGRILLRLSRLIEERTEALAVLESRDVGKPLTQARNDARALARYMEFYGGAADKVAGQTIPYLDGYTVYTLREPHGVTGHIIPWNYPMQIIGRSVGAALAMGNACVLKPAEEASLTALAFARLAQEAGLPPGALNVIPGTGEEAGAALSRNPGVRHLSFTGSAGVGTLIQQAAATNITPVTLELGGKSPQIVFADADLDAAMPFLLSAGLQNAGQTCSASSRILVERPLWEEAMARMAEAYTKLTAAPALEDANLGPLISARQKQIVQGYLSRDEGLQVLAEGTISETAPTGGHYIAPRLYATTDPAHILAQEEIFGPVLVSCTFRTPDEAIALANNTRYGLAATLWSENINLALHVAPQLAAGVVWINGTNMFDAAAGFGGVRESGFGREGGWEGLLAYSKPVKAPKKATTPTAFEGNGAPADPLDRTAKMYIGGKQARPDSGYSTAIHGPKGDLLGHVGTGSRKDIRNAVEAAASAKGWAKSSAHLRAQILFYLAENLSARSAEFAARIKALTGKSGTAEVEASISRLFAYAAWADKLDGAAKPVPLRGTAVAFNEPCGVIGALCSPAQPLLGLVSAIGPAIAMGNRIVACPSEPFPLIATDFYQLLDTSDVPGGVVNIVTGPHADLAKTLAEHMEVDSVWNFSDPDLTAGIEKASAGNLKRTLSLFPDWTDPATEGREMLAAATEIKTVWIPYGV